MTDPRELQAGDIVSIDLDAESADSGANPSDDESDTAEPLSGALWRVSDVEVEDIGITETFAVSLVSDSEGTWSIVGTTADSVGTVSEIDGDREVRINFNDISLE